jgi:hypothetical protein
VDADGELGLALADAGGAGAPFEWSARLRELLRAELERGARELAEPRTGRDRPIALAVAAGENGVLAVLPLPIELRADAGAVGDRARALAQAAVERPVEATDPGSPAAAADLALLVGDHDGYLGLHYPAADPALSAEYARDALDEGAEGIDRLRARTHLLPAHAIAVDDLRPPIGATHPLRVAEAASRLGGSALDEDTLESLEPQLVRLLEPGGGVTRAHDDPDPRRRVMRRILQRLDGMGKWGGYHTAFDHLARGFAGNERALAFEVGEELLATGLLEQKPSVGQRHVYLNTRRAADIRRLIDEGVLPPGL